MARLLVIDASLALKLILPNPLQAHLETLVMEWKGEGCELYAPTLWLYEITSALCKAVHFGALTVEEAQRALTLAQSLSVQLIPPDDAQALLAFDWTVNLDRAAAYDRFYLALAEALRGELWTADRKLYNAVAQPWVRWTGESGG